jgi:hypothetical protein
VPMRHRVPRPPPSVSGGAPLALQVLLVLFQVEGIEEHRLVMMAVPDAIEARNPIFAARNRLAVEDAGP